MRCLYLLKLPCSRAVLCSLRLSSATSHWYYVRLAAERSETRWMRVSLESSCLKIRTATTRSLHRPEPKAPASKFNRVLMLHSRARLFTGNRTNRINQPILSLPPNSPESQTPSHRPITPTILPTITAASLSQFFLTASMASP
jgi:hypothetical protein